MKVIDFSRSFVTFRIDTTKKPPRTVTHEPPFTLNNARVLVDCRCVIEEKDGVRTDTFVLGASCKTERVGVEGDIWTEPNADFVPVFSSTHFMHIKTYDQADKTVERFPPSRGSQPERLVESIEDAFDDVRVDMAHADGARLESTDAIVTSTLRNAPLVARTELESERYRASIEYPIKTMNASPRDQIYQTDTGPVLWPDLSRDWDELITGMELAFSAFNCESWTEFLVRRANPIAEGVRVYHYSDVVRADTSVRNQIFSIGDNE